MLCHERTRHDFDEPHVTCHFVGTTAALVLGGLAAGGSLGSAALQSHAAGKAADQQAAAAAQAQKYLEQINQPYLDLGQLGVSQLMKGLGGGQYGLGSIPQFQAPTLEQARNSPGYRFEQQQGIDAIQRSAAARGGLGSGSTLKALQSFGTGLADTTYGDVFNRAMQGYQANLQAQGQMFGQDFGVAGLGQNTATNLGHSISDLITGAGNARAAGTVGSANAWSSGINGATSGIMNALLLHGFGFGQQPGGGYAQPTFNPGSGPGYGYGPAYPGPQYGTPPFIEPGSLGVG